MKMGFLRGALMASALFGLGACAQFQQAVDTISAPAGTQAVANLESGARALVCALTAASATAASVEQAVQAGQAAVSTTGKVLVASHIVCSALGGAVAGVGTVR